MRALILILFLSLSQIASADIDLEFEGNFSASEKTLVKDWFGRTASNIGSYAGGYPPFDIKVTFKRQISNQPVPWGQVNRKNRSAELELQIDPRFGMDSMIEDWTLAHEISHLYIPYPGHNFRWFTEGFASYWQELGRSRNILSEKAVFENLFAGFRRGYRKTEFDNLSIDEITPHMRELRAFRRVYWAGAIYFMWIDLHLIEKSGGQQRLTDVILLFNENHRNKRQIVDGNELINALDELVDGNPFREHKIWLIDRVGYPDFAGLAKAFGVIMEGDNIRFNDDPIAKKRRKYLLEQRF